MESIEKLSRYTKSLSDFEHLERNYIEYTINNGVCVGYSLYHNSNIAIQRAFMRNGTSFPQHSHKEKEILVISSGKLKVTINNKSSIFERGDSLSFEMNQIHEVEALEDTWVIGITIPASEGYP